MIEWLLPLEIQQANTKFWKISPRQVSGIESKRNKRNAARLKSLMNLEKEKPKPPCVVTIERCYDTSKRSKPWDDDNWTQACKPIRDIIADLIVPGLPKGQADNPKHGISWQYAQSNAKFPGVKITIQPVGDKS